MLTIQQANEQLQTAYQKNPGPWVEHSRSVAENARRIAEHTDCTVSYTHLQPTVMAPPRCWATPMPTALICRWQF